MSLTRRLRDELAGAPDATGSLQRTELSGLLRFGGAWTVRAEGPGWVLDTTAASVLRRAHQGLVRHLGVRPLVEAHSPGGLSASTRYRLRVADIASLGALGLIDAEGQPLSSLPWALLETDAQKAAYLRGALQAAGGLSNPGQPPHLEVRASSARAAAGLGRLLAALGIAHSGTSTHGDSWRLVCKSGDDIGRVLVLTGAHGTFLEFDEGLLRRQIRGEATRATNAERANLGRAVAASARQVAMIERLVSSEDWGDLPEELRQAALARLANPHASLLELAGLLDTTKATVHRRLLRLEREAESVSVGWVESEGGNEGHVPSASDTKSGRHQR